jgi:DNA repair protein RadD
MSEKISFRDLISRADESSLGVLLGAATLRVLSLLDNSLTTPTALRRLLLETTNPQALLSSVDCRRELFQLLRLEEADSLCRELRVEGGDNPYGILASARISKSSAKERSLFEFFGIEPLNGSHLVEPRNALDPAIAASYGLFAHQRVAYRKTEHLLDCHPHRVLLHMPTGSGKTRTAMHLIANHLRSNEPGLVVWLAFSEELCSQASEEFQKAWESLGDREISQFKFWGDSDLDIESVHDGFLVAGLKKSYERALRDATFLSKLSDRSSLIIIDEAHQAIAPTYKYVLDTLTNRRPNVRLLGLSATPGRTWNEPAIDELLSEFFNRTKVSLGIEGYENPVEFLIDEGYLARPVFRNVEYSGTDLSGSDSESIAVGLDIPLKVLRLLAEDEQRNLLLIMEIERLLGTHNRILVFAATVEHAKLISDVLVARGHESSVVTAKTDRIDRNRIIQNFREDSDVSRVLCNFGVLTTGFDAPRTSAAVIGRPTKSLVLYSQMVGRATRGIRAGGNSEAEIVTVVDLGLPGFGDLGEAFLNWEDIWDTEEMT